MPPPRKPTVPTGGAMIAIVVSRERRERARLMRALVHGHTPPHHEPLEPTLWPMADVVAKGGIGRLR
eukprot:5542939-Prymnesium_polylepis.2